MKGKGSYHIYAFITIFCWSLAYVLTRLTVGVFSALALGFWRYAVAGVAILLVALVARPPLPKAADIPWILLAGATGFFAYMIAFNLGLQTVSAATGSVVIATAPVLTALLARLVFKEALRPAQYAAIGVEFAGVAVLTLWGGTLSVNTGVLWVLLAAVCISVYNLVQRRLSVRYTPLQSSIWNILAGSVMLCVFAPRGIAELPGATPPAIRAVVLMGVFSSAVAYIAWAAAFRRAEKTASVSNYMFLTPFHTSLMGILLLGEVPDASTLVGGAIILGGVALYHRGGKPKEKEGETE